MKAVTWVIANTNTRSKNSSSVVTPCPSSRGHDPRAEAPPAGCPVGRVRIGLVGHVVPPAASPALATGTS